MQLGEDFKQLDRIYEERSSRIFKSTQELYYTCNIVKSYGLYDSMFSKTILSAAGSSEGQLKTSFSS